MSQGPPQPANPGFSSTSSAPQTPRFFGGPNPWTPAPGRGRNEVGSASNDAVRESPEDSQPSLFGGSDDEHDLIAAQVEAHRQREKEEQRRRETVPNKVITTPTKTEGGPSSGPSRSQQQTTCETAENQKCEEKKEAEVCQKKNDDAVGLPTFLHLPPLPPPAVCPQRAHWRDGNWGDSSRHQWPSW